MARNAQQNAAVREARREQILDAALTVYLQLGFHGADMDAVAREAGLAKGLLYYYFQTKQALFQALYSRTIDRVYALSERVLRESEALNPVERLAAYTYALFLENRENTRLMRFCIRIPFDACAIFGPDGWQDGVRKSDLHRQALAGILADGMRQGLIPPADADLAANSLWSVFVANSFAYTRLIAAQKETPQDPADGFLHVVQFCFQGLGISRGVWTAAVGTAAAARRKGGNP